MNNKEITTTDQKLNIDYEVEYNKLRREVEALSTKLQWYEEQLWLNQHKQFGKSSEKADSSQISLFDEAEQEASAKVPEPTYEEISYKRKKQKCHRDAMMEDLPVERIEYELSDEDKTCSECDGTLHKMSEEIHRELKIIPAKVVVLERVKHVYSCRSCEKEGIEVPIVKAKAPNPVLPNSFVSPSLMSFVMSRKYDESLPLYRQEQQFKHYGIDISRQTLANWMIHGAERWLVHLYNHMHKHLLTLGIIHSDETELQVLKEDGRSASSKSYMWHYASGHTDVPIALYDYQTTRAKKHPEAFLDGYKGYIHADGYQGYNNISNTKLVGCWAHAKRYFNDAQKSLNPSIETISHTKCSEALLYFSNIFATDKKLADLTPEERYEQRLIKCKPIMDEFLLWLKQMKKTALPKSGLGKAIAYCLNHWETLENVLLDGRLEFTNNLAERNIKQFVMGRNYVFKSIIAKDGYFLTPLKEQGQVP